MHSKSAKTVRNRKRSSRIYSKHKYKLKENVGLVVTKKELKTSFLNVDGLSRTSLADVHDFIDSTNPDVVFLFETKRREEQICFDIGIQNYDHFELRRSDVSKHKKGGGIACFTRKLDGLHFERFHPDLHSDLEYINYERVWLKVNSLCTKTAILGVYAGCQYDDDRHAVWNSQLYEVLKAEVNQLRSEGYRIKFCGDFNGHVGSQIGQGIPGNNSDINLNGTRFLDFLESCSLRHINGECRIPGLADTRICQGLWTWQKGNARSVIDYAGVSEEYLHSVVSMFVDEKGCYGGNSDHNWVTLVLKDCFRRKVLRQNIRTKERWDISDDQDWVMFQEHLTAALPSFQEAKSNGVDALAQSITKALRNAGLSAVGLKEARPRGSYLSRSLPQDIVRELRKKRVLEHQWKCLGSGNLDDVLPSEVSDAESAYLVQKKIVSDLLKSHHSAKEKETLKDKNAFWSAVSGKVKQSADIGAVLDSDNILKCEPQDIRTEVEKHFTKIFDGSVSPAPSSDKEDGEDTRFIPSTYGDHTYAVKPIPILPEHDKSELLDTNPNAWMGRRFSAKEIKNVAKTLLSNKACGWDSLPNEFIKNGSNHLFLLLSLLFNKMRDTNTFPHGWNRGRITLIHKRGSRFLLGNYRPITVIISLAALYSKVLNLRLAEVVERHNLLGEFQGGFRKGRGCPDNTFILHTILWKAKARRRLVHLAFLDVTKAYDSVNREILWSKLAKMGIKGHFLKMLKAMYQGDSVDTVVNGLASRPIFLKRGLRQGCALSPLLFNLYISDMGHDLMFANEGFYLTAKLCVSFLFFADDIILISRTARGLKRLLELVQHHAMDLKLEISEEKSQVISPSQDRWNITSEDGSVISLKQVLHYKYLGIETFSTIFKTICHQLKRCVTIAKKYMFACLHLSRASSDPVRLALASWESIAVPSILFGCESIPFSEAKMIDLERIEGKVAKMVLGVPVNTSIICAQSELGIKPIRMCIYLRQLKFYFRVLSLPSNRWVKVAMMDHLSGQWKSPYIEYICKLRSKLGLQDEPPTMRYLKRHVTRWALDRANDSISSLNLPFVEPLTAFKRAEYVVSHRFLPTIAGFRLSNGGLGNKCPVVGLPQIKTCPLCMDSHPVNEAHLLFGCHAMKEPQMVLGLRLFHSQCAGDSLERVAFLYINGRDEFDNAIEHNDYVTRGSILKRMVSIWISLLTT